MKKRIIDKRQKEKYMMDDEYLNGMARLCGWKGTIVYTSLCRHASKDQECFPSIKLMAEQHDVGKDTILKGLKILEERKVIEIKKTRSKGGQWLNNTYILLDKSEWNYNQVAHSDTVHQVAHSVAPSRSQRHDQVAHSDTKETHKQGNTLKETHTSELSSQVNYVIDVFYNSINPTINYGNKTIRSSTEWMIKKWGVDAVIRMSEYACFVHGKQYAPTITTPHQLKEKISSLKAYKERQDANQELNVLSL
jgi:hypothetical protein